MDLRHVRWARESEALLPAWPVLAHVTPRLNVGASVLPSGPDKRPQAVRMGFWGAAVARRCCVLTDG
jgi:hypothetical protein